MDDNQAETVLNTDEVSAFLKVQPATVRWWRHRHKGPPFIRLAESNQVRYRLSSLEEWLYSQEVDFSKPGPKPKKNRTVPSPRVVAVERNVVAR